MTEEIVILIIGIGPFLAAFIGFTLSERKGGEDYKYLNRRYKWKRLKNGYTYKEYIDWD